jgi:pro-kumamolisin-like protein/VCBS repeat protein
MNDRLLGGLRVAATSAFVFAFLPSAQAQFAGNSVARPLITAPVIETNLVRLAGNVRSEANPANDLGAVADGFSMDHMFIQLQRPATEESTLRQLIDQLHDPNSPNFHRWLTPDQFGAQFGPAASDIQQVTNWLQGRGFRVNFVYPSGMTIDFSGNAGQVAAAFRTEIHNVVARGTTLFTNVSDPQIPAALAPAVAGIVGLNNFTPRPRFKKKSDYTFSGCGATCYAVTPPDLATIYNFSPVFTAGNTGQNQTIYLIEDTNLFTNNDWTTFRSTFGLSAYSGASLSTVHPAPPSGPTNCANPNTNSNDGEAILDAEYASAASPSAAIVIASCADTPDGILIAIQNLINAANPPAIISISYGECEALNGAASNAAYNAIYQQGVAEGVSIFVSSGDEDTGGCDINFLDLATFTVTHGIAVNALASSPYVVAVGGTDFSDTYSGTNSTYWNGANTPSFGSAKSYIPEIPWNDSCASVLIATVEGFATTYGSAGFCNSSPGQDFLNNVGGSGGPSACATGSPSIPGVVSGTCAGYAKPSWQSALGNPNDGVRDIPDVSLFAANGVWGHYYVFCYSDTSNGGKGCGGSPSGWNGAGGTSFAAPIMAGVQALINQHTGSRQGNPNYRLYALAAKEYGVSGSASCNSSTVNAVSSSCIFYDVTLGDIDAPCTSLSGTLYNCYLPSGSTYGVLSTSNASYQPAYGTQTGWDFATGLGTINVANLVSGWNERASTHDFNGDGESDILWRDTSGNVAIWEMNGTTVLNAATSFVANVGGTWTIAGTGDFNGDGKSDILWHDTSGNVAIWEMNGTAVLNPATSFVANVPGGWSIVGTGDFNGDGKSDILWRDTSGNVAIWEMNGTTVLNPATSFVANVANNWSVFGNGDYNGDGKSDILWHDSSGNVAIWEMNGTTVLNPATSFVGNVSGTWAIAGTGDFNGDGKSDILWHDGSGNVAIFEMNGTTILNPATSFVANVPGTWSIYGSGDYNAAGKSDVGWRDGSGNVAIWEMNGTTVLNPATSFVTNVAGTWSIQDPERN